MMSDNKVIDLVTDKNYFSISCWDNKGELYFGNNKFEELFGQSMSKINIDDFRKHIDNYCFSEDLEKFDQFIGQEESSLLKSVLVSSSTSSKAYKSSPNLFSFE